MALFKRKSDPITERARALNDQIARLEAQIQALSAQYPNLSPTAEPFHNTSPAQPQEPSPPPPRRVDDQEPATDPSLSAAHAAPTRSKPAPPAEEPAFEEVGSNPFKGATQRPRPEKQPRELGIRKSDFSTIWRRFRNNFRGPATSNPQLVKYIAAGSLQGLRPLRYEKRVARNRFILLLVCLVLVLWGIIAIVM